MNDIPLRAYRRRSGRADCKSHGCYPSVGLPYDNSMLARFQLRKVQAGR
jgi:hypothetical protein